MERIRKIVNEHTQTESNYSLSDKPDSFSYCFGFAAHYWQKPLYSSCPETLDKRQPITPVPKKCGCFVKWK